MKLLADHCVPESICQFLEDRGHEVPRLRSLMPTNSPDEVVIAKARELDTVLISLNGDFSHIENYPPSQYGGIISIRFKNRPQLLPAVLDNLASFIEGKSNKDMAGILLIVEATGCKVRRTP